ncbi:hypothetical protein TI05_09725 [Achromatium sp. WMS3]|nr:hypothetical protein TI05_09725 [Achromatium sp. WMS3]
MADNINTQPPEDTHASVNLSVHESYDPMDQSPYALDRLSHAFETSARRWELIVYPSMFAFIILAAYGFYLVFSLAKDMHYLTISVDSNMTLMSSNMQAMADHIGQLTHNVRAMTVQVESMAVQVESMAENVKTLEPMLASIKNMDQSMQSMTMAINNIRNDVGSMNHHIGQGMGRPMSFFNSFMPW